MGKITLPDKAKLFIGAFGVDKDVIESVKGILEDLCGIIDHESDLIDFKFTDYYKEEMGDNLKRQFFSFKKLIQRDDIAEIKIKTNRIEEDFQKEKKLKGRNINIDPGYLTLSTVALATTKDYMHRVYVRKGIFVENTLHYNSKIKTYDDWAWTYPDYQTSDYKKFFNNIRMIYHKQLKYGEDFERDF